MERRKSEDKVQSLVGCSSFRKLFFSHHILPNSKGCNLLNRKDIGLCPRFPSFLPQSISKFQTTEDESIYLPPLTLNPQTQCLVSVFSGRQICDNIMHQTYLTSYIFYFHVILPH